MVKIKYFYFLGKIYTFKLFDGALKASDLEKVKDSTGGPLRSYDPAFMNTISCVNTNFKNVDFKNLLY
jgi:hypothetical protein